MNTNRIMDNKSRKTQTKPADRQRDLVKRVEYSYASSPNAVRFGFAKTGCYSVELTKGITPPKAIAGYSNRDATLLHAESLPNAWCKMWLRFNPSYAASHLGMVESNTATL